MRIFTLLLATFAFSVTMTAQQAQRPAAMKLGARLSAAHKAGVASKALVAKTHPVDLKERITPISAIPVTSGVSDLRKPIYSLLAADDASDQKDVQNLYLPGHETSYMWNENEQDWEKDSEYFYTYDGQGRIASYIVDDGEAKIRTSYQYDNEGRAVSQLQELAKADGEWENVVLKTSEYDPMAKNLIVNFTTSQWKNGEWVVEGNNYRRKVERDADGVVTLVLIQTLHEGEWADVERIVNTVADGKVSSSAVDIAMGYEADGSTVWQNYTYFTDFVWERTNGQVVTDYMYDLVVGENRFAYAKLVNDEGGADVTVTYANKEDYRCAMEYPEFDYYYHELEVLNHKVTDEYGSYKETYNDYLDLDDDGEFTDDELNNEATQVMTCQFDAHGNEILYTGEAWDSYAEDLVCYECVRTDYTYDDNGAATQFIQYSGWDEENEDGEWIRVESPDFKVEADDIQCIEVKPVGIDRQPLVQTPAGEQTYYDLSGRKVQQPSRGVYVTASGCKVLVK